MQNAKLPASLLRLWGRSDMDNPSEKASFAITAAHAGVSGYPRPVAPSVDAVVFEVAVRTFHSPGSSRLTGICYSTHVMIA